MIVSVYLDILISIVVFFLSLFLFNRFGGSLKITEINAFTYIFFYSLILQSFVSSILVITKIDHHYIISTLSDESRFFGWLSIQWTMIGVPIGFIIARLFSKVKEPKIFIRKYCQSEFGYFSKNYEKCLYYIFVFLSFLSILATIYYCYIIGGISIIKVIKSPSLFFTTYRNDVKNNFAGIEQIRNIFSIGLSPILSLIWFSYYTRDKKLLNKIMFITMTIMTIIALTNNLEKAPIFDFFIKFLFLYVLINGRIKRRYIYTVGIVIITMIICLYVFILHQPFNSLFRVNSGILGRIVLTQSAGTYCSFEYFPYRHEYLGFSSFPNWITNIFNITHSERSARICMRIFNPEGVTSGIANVINSLFVAESWANWGRIGVVFAPIYVGFFIHMVLFKYMKKEKHPIYVGFIAYLSSFFPFTGGINDFIYPITIILYALILKILFWGAEIFEKSVSINKKCE